MKTTLHVLYAKDEGTRFNRKYFLENHAPMTRRILIEYIDSMLISEGTETFPDQPAEVYFTVTFVFRSRDAFDKSDRVAHPIHEDISNFYNRRPKLLVGKAVELTNRATKR